MSFELITIDGDPKKRPRSPTPPPPLWGDEQDNRNIIVDLTDEIAACHSVYRNSLHIPNEFDNEKAAMIASQIYEKAKDWYLESTLDGHRGHVSSVAFSPDGERIVSGGRDETIRIWNAKTGEVERMLQGHSRGRTGECVMSVAFSPDGERVVSGGSDATIRIWNAKTGEVERVLQGHSPGQSEEGVMSVAFSPHGERIVSGGNDKTIRIWNAKTGEVERVLELGNVDLGREPWDPSKGVVRSVAFSPDGERIVCGGEEARGSGRILIWNADTGERLSVFHRITGSVMSVAFSPNGKRIVSGNNWVIQIWNAETGEIVRTIQEQDGVRSVVFSPDGKHIVYGRTSPHGSNYADDTRKTIQIWNAETGNFVRTLEGHEGYVTSVAFSPDGERIVSGGLRGEIKIWKFDVRLA